MRHANVICPLSRVDDKNVRYDERLLITSCRLISTYLRYQICASVDLEG